MADAQDLKSWDRKKSCRFESDHRHQTEPRVLEWVAPVPIDPADGTAGLPVKYPWCANGRSMRHLPDPRLKYSERRSSPSRFAYCIDAVSLLLLPLYWCADGIFGNLLDRPPVASLTVEWR